MTETRFTPGPWDARKDRTVGAAGVPLLRCYAGRNEESNTYLIAAAPDLYEALYRAVQLLETLGHGSNSFDVALAKARGEA